MKIVIPQLQKTLEDVPAGANLLAVLCSSQVPVARSCGGEGVCGTCRVHIEGDHIPEPSSLEQKLHRKQSAASGPSERNRYACLIRTSESSKNWAITADYW